YVITVPTRGTRISGTVKLGKKPLKGVKIKAPEAQTTSIGGLDASAETNDKGKYYLNVTSGWSGTLILEKKGYKISPAKHTAPQYRNVVDDIEKQDFQAENISMISGKVKDKNGEPVADVELSFIETDDGKKETAPTVSTNEDGYYSYTVKPGWKGSVKPAKDWYPFEPGVRTFPKQVFSAIKNQDFEAQVQEIKGRVTYGKRKGLKKKVELTFVNGINTPGKPPEKKKFTSTNKEDGTWSAILPAGWT
ncbi:MAG: carboxypeptidase regulatory-like domain-containing protein, partial [bacterium]|nr:carboxypeptidase regulatory-like domain-containing protein [bacterium]